MHSEVDSLLGIRPRRVFDDEDRVHVSDTTQYPYSTNCRLFVRFPNLPPDEVYVASGTLIGRMHVLTAAHVVYNPDPAFGGWATSIKVVPGQDWPRPPYEDPYEPYGSEFVTLIRKSAFFEFNSRDYQEDYAMLTLETFFRYLGEETGWMDMQPSYTDGQEGTISGYPAAPPDGLFPGAGQYYASGPTRNIFYPADRPSDRVVYHEIDVTFGQSGSGTFYYDIFSERARVFAVQGSERDDGFRVKNVSVLINQQRYNNLTTYMLIDDPY
jgi:V8-like Glu-specific endopeptidase